jgi:speckle-type POZ protein
VFQVGGDEFSVHQCVLAARSPVLRAALFGSMRDGAMFGEKCTIRIDDMSPLVFKIFLHFVYTDSAATRLDGGTR